MLRTIDELEETEYRRELMKQVAKWFNESECTRTETRIYPEEVDGLLIPVHIIVEYLASVEAE